MSKIKLTGSNSGYVEISSAADAGNLTLALPTSGTELLSNGNNVYTGITTFSNDVKFEGASYDVLWDKSDNQLEFGTNAKLSFGASSDLQIHRSGTHSYIKNSSNTLVFNSDAISLTNYAGNSNRIVTAASGEVKLYYSDSVKLETTNTGAVVTGICTATSFSGSGEGLTRTTQLSHRNIVINGAMLVAQRSTSSTTSGYGSVDRFQCIFTGVDEAPTQAQVNVSSGTTPFTLGFRKAFKVTNGNQTGGAGTLDFITMRTRIEAQDMANSGWNYTSSSSFITLSFWVKSSVAQNFYGYLYTHDGTAQAYAFETGSLTANTWTKVVLKIPGNSNLQFDNNTNEGLDIYISQFWGTDRTDGGKTLNSWSSYNGAARTRDFTTTWYTTNDATFELTGVQLEVGEQATPFEHRSFANELRRCYRYFQRRTDGSNYQWVSLVSYYANSEIHGFFDHYETMRTSPTLSTDTGANTLAVQRAGGYAVFTTGLVKNGGNNNVTYYYRDGVTLGTSGQAGRCLTWTSGCNITLDAEF